MNTLSLLQDVEGYQIEVASSGLTKSQVLERRAQSGENCLPSEKGISAWTILFNQLKSPLVYIILAVAGTGSKDRCRSVSPLWQPQIVSAAAASTVRLLAWPLSDAKAGARA
jgi:hypothetical protein